MQVDSRLARDRYLIPSVTNMDSTLGWPCGIALVRLCRCLHMMNLCDNLKNGPEWIVAEMVGVSGITSRQYWLSLNVSGT